MQYYINSHPSVKSECALFSSVFIPKNTMVFDVSKLPIVSCNNKYAITVNETVYLDTTNTPVRFLNHSCNPTLSLNKYNSFAISDTTPIFPTPSGNKKNKGA